MASRAWMSWVQTSAMWKFGIKYFNLILSWWCVVLKAEWRTLIGTSKLWGSRMGWRYLTKNCLFKILTFSDFPLSCPLDMYTLLSCNGWHWDFWAFTTTTHSGGINTEKWKVILSAGNPQTWTYFPPKSELKALLTSNLHENSKVLISLHGEELFHLLSFISTQKYAN